MFVISIVMLSILLQITAAVAALRLIKITGRLWSWTFIAAAMVLQASRRITVLYDLANGSLTDSQVQTSEIIGLILSIFMLLGVASIEPFFAAQAQNIKERKRNEKELKKTIEKMQELDKLKDDFLNLTTHELKNPLIPIKSQSQLLLANDYGDLNKNQQEAIEMILKNEESLDKLASDILDISKIKSNKFNLTPEKASLEEIISETVKNAKKMAEEKNLSLLILPISELPKILIDKRRIGQVLDNLINNAIKFTPEGGEIKIKTHKNENEVIIAVEDTGIGLSKENIEKLFDPFFQVQSNLAKKYRGTGLGLPICKGIIEAHGGKIWIESLGDGKGSSFIFSLPIK